MTFEQMQVLRDLCLNVLKGKAVQIYHHPANPRSCGFDTLHLVDGSECQSYAKTITGNLLLRQPYAF